MAFATWKYLKPVKYFRDITSLRKCFTDEKYEVEIVRQGGKKIMPSKLQFDLRNGENKEVKNKQEESREATTLKLDRWDSMQYLTPNSTELSSLIDLFPDPLAVYGARAPASAAVTHRRVAELCVCLSERARVCVTVYLNMMLLRFCAIFRKRACKIASL
ncbi:hypothetical protein DPX16_3869 [Anabarilius grahami]|uniref:Uncharacterized protein n=1 Tax=Anabarilius grahami TaxID=495550 RepID=A0A3N0XTH0_ANAGA|nr:hypothetical protein DPX16_3869 [Anabarilius grahami]